jgi:hypothetical protein
VSGVAGMPLPGWAPELRPCGTLAAYRRHLRRGEPVDESCRQAAVRDQQDRVAAGYARPSRAGRGRVHLGGGCAPAACGRKDPARVTGTPWRATCRSCLAVLRRHGAKLEREPFEAVLARQAAARERAA